MMVKRKANLDDGCNPELVAGAVFDGELEIPVIHAPAEIVIPSGITPFSKREKAIGTDEAVGFFEKDPVFSKVLINPSSYVEDFRRFRFLLPVDCSLYRDAPLAVQVANLYRSRALGSYYQRNGCNVYPLVRWGNELTYTTRYFPERIALNPQSKSKKSISSERTNTMVQAKFTSEMIDCLRKLIGESFVSYDGAIMNQTAYGNLQLNTEHFSVELRNEVHPFSLFSEVEDVSCFSCIFKERVLYSNRFVRNRGKQYQLMKK